MTANPQTVALIAALAVRLLRGRTTNMNKRGSSPLIVLSFFTPQKFVVKRQQVRRAARATGQDYKFVVYSLFLFTPRTPRLTEFDYKFVAKRPTASRAREKHRVSLQIKPYK